MDPRTLVAPTVTVFLIIASVAAAFYYAGDSATDAEENVEEIDLQSRSAVKSYLSGQIAAATKRNILFYGTIAALIFFCPINLTDGMSNRVLKLLIGAFLVLVGNFASGHSQMNSEIVMRIMMLGGLLLGIIFIVRTIRKLQPQDKRPCHMRWSSQHRVMAPDTDPETLAKLDRWRDIAAGSEPAFVVPPSGGEPVFESFPDSAQ